VPFDNSPGVVRQGWEAFKSILRDDPGLVANGVTVWAPELERTQLREKGFKPNLNQLPLIRVTPRSFATRRESNVHHFGEMEILVECFCPDFEAGDIMDLWGLFILAIWPLDPDRNAVVKQRFAIMQPDGAVVTAHLAAQAQNPTALGSDEYGQFAEGNWFLHFLLKTT
jgi:hypothetical protein